MKKTAKIFGGILLIVWGIYLLLPSPPELPPLSQSLKSVEPGDTTQIPGISAYYTDLSRQEVIDFYQKSFSHSSFLGIPLLTYRLNYPPEYAKQIIRSTQQSSYLEEVVHPLRESLFVSGFEWANDPFTKSEKRVKNKMIIDRKEYKAKITLITRNSNPIFRLLVSVGFMILGWWMIKEVTVIGEEGLKFIKRG